MVLKFDYGTCAVCNRHVRIRPVLGTVVNHGNAKLNQARTCIGSNKPPKRESDE